MRKSERKTTRDDVLLNKNSFFSVFLPKIEENVQVLLKLALLHHNLLKSIDISLRKQVSNLIK
jgi:hypothetical protein